MKIPLLILPLIFPTSISAQHFIFDIDLTINQHSCQLKLSSSKEGIANPMCGGSFSLTYTWNENQKAIHIDPQFTLQTGENINQLFMPSISTSIGQKAGYSIQGSDQITLAITPYQVNPNPSHLN